MKFEAMLIVPHTRLLNIDSHKLRPCVIDIHRSIGMVQLTIMFLVFRVEYRFLKWLELRLELNWDLWER